MPHISRHKMDKKMQEKFFAEFKKLIIQANAKNTHILLDTLITDTEKTMFTKRLAAALLFSQGYSTYTVWNTLKISPSTSHKIRLKYESGVYNNLLKVAKKKNYIKIITTLEKILQMGMPPRNNKRWQFLDRK